MFKSPIFCLYQPDHHSLASEQALHMFALAKNLSPCPHAFTIALSLWFIIINFTSSFFMPLLIWVQYLITSIIVLLPLLNYLPHSVEERGLFDTFLFSLLPVFIYLFILNDFGSLLWWKIRDWLKNWLKGTYTTVFANTNLLVKSFCGRVDSII